MHQVTGPSNPTSFWNPHSARIGLLLIVALSAVSYSEIARTHTPTLQAERSGAACIGEEAVTITGRGFRAGERVLVRIAHADGTAEPGMGHDVSRPTVRPDGTFEVRWVPAPTDLVRPEFVVAASGDVSGATAPAVLTRAPIVTTDDEE